MNIIRKLETGFKQDPRDFLQTQSVKPGSAIGLINPDASKDKKIPTTFTPFTQRGLVINNRLVVSPMCTYSCQDGFLNDFHIAHYGGFAMHSPGAIVVEATAVVPEGRISIFCNGIYKDEHIQPHQRVVNIVKAQGVPIGIQLAHAGRKASGLPPWISTTAIAGEEIGGWPTNVYGASARPFDETQIVPHELTISQIEDLVDQFKAATVRADKAGYDFIEIHAAHGYLISTFLSQNSNKRTDKYGGSIENRTLMLVQIVKAARSVLPEHKPIWVRLSCNEWVDDGFTPDDAVTVSRILKDCGVDLIDCSSGGISSHQKIVAKPLYQVPYAEAIKQQVGIPTAAVGIISTSAEFEDILNSNKADLIFMARPFLRDASIVKRIAIELNVDLEYTHQYTRGKRNKL
ncbi:putative NADPH dehydrogenase [Smittium culicis]|uniref:Putative NADPH dehydrogenase n=1 Tax=Smittium culicis TaxID=133412 RepID=A0A1R1YSE0_9FUNG|nr:putative NADPH dehydrogenase [Smittium culicis]OMJ29819.1 putative NADPH dehydrogenase [Smittium culicis]